MMIWICLLVNLMCAMENKGFFERERKYKRHPTEKMKEMLKSVDKKAKLCVLLTTGSMNPIHKAHVHGFEYARKHLEEEDYAVVGGFLSPSDKGWSEGKKFGAMKNDQKLKMAELAVEDSDWIACDGWEIETGMINFPCVYKDLQKQLGKDFPEKPIKIFYLCGEDHANKTWCWESMPTCVIKRDYEGKRNEDFLKGAKSENLHKVSVNDHLDYSSTKIREAMTTNHLEEVRHMMHPKVFEYLAEIANKSTKK